MVCCCGGGALPFQYSSGQLMLKARLTSIFMEEADCGAIASGPDASVPPGHPAAWKLVTSRSLPGRGRGRGPGDVPVLGRPCDGCPFRACRAVPLDSSQPRGHTQLINGVPAAGRGHCSSCCSTGGGGWGLGPDQGREVAHAGLLGPLLCLMSGGIEWWAIRRRQVLYSGAGKNRVFP